MLSRTVQSELLDSLPAHEPAARRSRFDLRLINGLMGNFRWAERRLHRIQPPHRVIELGAGEGRLASRLSRQGFDVTAVDLAPRPTGLPDSVHWVQGDLFEITDFSGAIVVATLFLHHLEPPQLRRLGRQLTKARALVFSEPWRSRLSLTCGYTLFPFVNHVTRHDMMVSIRAGFRSGELPEALELDDNWSIHEQLSLFGACRLFATQQ